MNINTRDLGFINFNGEEMQWVKFNNVIVYEAWKKLIASGVPPITLQKCKGVDLVDYKIYGNSVQESENLFNTSIQLTNGIYLNKNGVETNNSIWYVTDYIEVSGYEFTLNNVGGNTPSICAYDENKNFITGVNYGTENADIKTSVTISSNTLIRYIRFSIYKMWIQSEADNNILLTHKPTPETPIEIESVGDKTKNLFDKDNINIISSWNVKTSSILSTKTGLSFSTTADRGHLTLNIGSMSKYAGKTLVFTSPSYYDSASTKLIIRDAENNLVKEGSNWTSDGNGLYYSTLSIGADEYLDGILTVRFYFASQEIGDVLEWENIMITESNTPVEYEPYGYKIPVKIVGKNLFNKDDLQEGYMSPTGFVQSSYFSCSDYITIKPDTDYYFSGVPKAADMGAVRWYDQNKKYISSTTFTINEGVAKSPANARYCIVNIIKSKKDTTQVELGTSKSNYESYTETVNKIYLKEPLRKIGNYADYIDFEQSKVLRKIEKINLQNREWYYLKDNIDYEMYTIVSDASSNDQYTILCYSNLYVPKSRYSVYHGSRGICIQGKYMRITQDVEKFNGSTSDFANYINSLDIAYALYVLETSKEETIELPNIPTFKGTSIIDVNTNILPSNMEVEYMGKE